MKSSKGIKKGGGEGEIISQIRFWGGEEILRLDETRKTKKKKKGRKIYGIVFSGISVTGIRNHRLAWTGSGPVRFKKSLEKNRGPQ